MTTSLFQTQVDVTGYILRKQLPVIVKNYKIWLYLLNIVVTCSQPASEMLSIDDLSTSFPQFDHSLEQQLETNVKQFINSFSHFYLYSKKTRKEDFTVTGTQSSQNNHKSYQKSSTWNCSYTVKFQNRISKIIFLCELFSGNRFIYLKKITIQQNWSMFIVIPIFYWTGIETAFLQKRKSHRTFRAS